MATREEAHDGLDTCKALVRQAVTDAGITYDLSTFDGNWSTLDSRVDQVFDAIDNAA
jgi:hypothetical protein